MPEDITDSVCNDEWRARCLAGIVNGMTNSKLLPWRVEYTCRRRDDHQTFAMDDVGLLVVDDVVRGRVMSDGVLSIDGSPCGVLDLDGQARFKYDTMTVTTDGTLFYRSEDDDPLVSYEDDGRMNVLGLHDPEDGLVFHGPREARRWATFALLGLYIRSDVTFRMF